MKKYRLDASEQLMCQAASNGRGSYGSPTIITVLKERVNPAALTYAVEEAMAFHPYFATRLIEEDGLFYWQENNRKPVLFEKPLSEEHLFGDKSNHYFPWLITYFDHSIGFDFAHELTDGGGAHTFHSTLMEYYTRYIRGDMSRIVEKTTREERIESETALPTEIAYREGVQALVQPTTKKGSPFQAEKMGAAGRVNILSIDLPMLRQVSFGYDASPFALIVPILSRALLPYFEGEHKVVKLLIVQNIRSYFHSQSLHIFSVSNDFYYNDDIMRKMSIEQVATLFRSRLDLLSDKSNVEAYYTALYELNQVIHIPEVQTQGFKKIMGVGFDPAIVPSSHVTRLGLSEQAMEHIADVYLNRLTTLPSVVCLALNFGNRVNLTMITPFSDDDFVADICAQFNELNVPCSVKNTGAFANRSFVLHTEEDSE